MLTFLRQAIALVRATPGRRGHVVEPADCTELLVCGDMHGHVGNSPSVRLAPFRQGQLGENSRRAELVAQGLAELVKQLGVLRSSKS